jgi:hypothetical protein
MIVLELDTFSSFKMPIHNSTMNCLINLHLMFVVAVCNQCLSPLMLWVRISISARCTALCDKVCQWHATGQRFSTGPLVSSINKTDRHDITEILLKVESNTSKQTNKHLVAVEWLLKFRETIIIYNNTFPFAERKVDRNYKETPSLDKN